MANFFNYDTTILDFSPRSHLRYSLRKYILWPAFAYKVVAPDLNDCQINFIQKAILGFCRAGIIDPEKIALRLYLHSDLVAFIRVQLQESGYLNDSFYLTSKGSTALNDEETSLEKSVVGYVFQDPWNGELWPRFVDKLNQPDKEFGEKGYPVLELGKKGKGSPSIEPYLEIPGNHEVVFLCPEPKEILRASMRHSRAKKLSGYFVKHPTQDEESDDTNIEIIPHRLKRISLIDQTPLPVFLLTYVYLPEDTNEGFDWFVCDPFGLGSSPSLKKAMLNKCAENPKLVKFLKTINNKKQEIIVDLKEDYSLFRLNAELKIDELLGIEIRSIQLYDSLLSMQSALEEANHLGDICRIDKLKDILIRTHSVLEGLFIHLRTKYPTDNSWKILYTKLADGQWKPMDDRNYRKELFNQIANSMGFSVPLPERLVTVKPGKIRSASCYNTGSLRPYLLATLLATSTSPNHPLRAVAAQEPNLFAKINHLADLRDTSGHYQLDKVKMEINLDLIRNQVEFCFYVVSMFLKSLLEIQNG